MGGTKKGKNNANTNQPTGKKSSKQPKSAEKEELLKNLNQPIKPDKPDKYGFGGYSNYQTIDFNKIKKQANKSNYSKNNNNSYSGQGGGQPYGYRNQQSNYKQQQYYRGKSSQYAGRGQRQQQIAQEQEYEEDFEGEGGGGGEYGDYGQENECEEEDEDDGQEKNWNSYAVNHRAQNFKNYAEKATKIYEESNFQQLPPMKRGRGSAAAAAAAANQFNRMHAFSFGIAKAGMENVNEDKVEGILRSAITNKQYYITQEVKMKEVEEKIKKYKQKIKNYKTNQKLWDKTKAEVKLRLDVYRKERDLTRTWLHVDMDMFYAAVEIREKPELKDRPIAVGDYSMIQTTNYVARKFGVRSAMPGFMGKKLCPGLVFIKPDKEKYKKVSDTEFKVILREYDDKMESVGLDEANLDITDYLRAHGFDMPEGRIFVAEKIRARIKERMRMTSSVGIACNKMLAKICSEVNKPDGYSYLAFDAEKIEEFMKPKKVRDIPGVGKVQEQILIGLGINTCEEIIQNSSDIYINFTENAFEFLTKASMGISRCNHEDDAGLLSKRSISFCKSFRTISRKEQFQEKLEDLSVKLSEKCMEMRVLARTLSIEFKSEKFLQKQKSITFNEYIAHKDDILRYALALLDSVWPLEPCRTIALKLNNMRYRTAKDKDAPIVGENLKFFTGKGRKKGCLTAVESIMAVKNSLLTNEPNAANATGLQPTLSAMLYHERKKEKEERYKKLIGQQDIKNFFCKKPTSSDDLSKPSSLDKTQPDETHQQNTTDTTTGENINNVDNNNDMNNNMNTIQEDDNSYENEFNQQSLNNPVDPNLNDPKFDEGDTMEYQEDYDENEEEIEEDDYEEMMGMDNEYDENPEEMAEGLGDQDGDIANRIQNENNIDDEEEEYLENIKRMQEPNKRIKK